MPSDPNLASQINRLHEDLGFQRLNPVWAKLEILIGLAMVGGSLRMPEAIPAVGLFTLGGYLAMAGSRSHLYQSMNNLTAHLATLIRDQDKPA